MKTRKEPTCIIDDLPDRRIGMSAEDHAHCPKCFPATHTPTPWKLQMNDDLTIIGEPEGDGDYRFVASVDSTMDTGGHKEGQLETDQANAAFIVKAVNAHEELLTALKLAYAALRDPNTRHQSADGRGITETITQAIAKAEGKE